MTILICGLGSIGRRHLSNLRSLGYEDIALLRSGKSTLDDSELRGLPVERELAAALERWRPVAVVVSNPTALHLDVAIPAAEAGCHLLIEKPVSHNLERLDELHAALRRGGGEALIGFQFRYHPGFQTMREVLASGVIGRPLSVRAHWGEYLPGWHPWEDYRVSYSARADLGGGVVLTLSHPFDYLRWMLGEVISAEALTSRAGELEWDVEDTADITLQFEGGCHGNIHLNYNQRPPSHGLEFIGTGGTLRWSEDDGVVLWWSDREAEWVSIQPQPGFERNQMFLAEMSHFLEVIEGGSRPRCTLEDGIRALEIAVACLRSSAEGRRIKLQTGAPEPGPQGEAAR